MAAEKKTSTTAKQRTQKPKPTENSAPKKPTLRPSRHPRGGLLYTGGVPGNRGGKGRPITHGRYSKLKHQTLGKAIAEFEKDPDPLNMLAEVHLARALLQNWIERYDQFIEALLAWHATSKAGGEASAPRPGSIPDLGDGYRLLSEVTKIIKRIEDIRNANAVSRSQLFRVMREMWGTVIDAVEKHGKRAKSPDGVDAILKEIENGWLTLKLD